jgi:4-hydroxy-tetrahydrodipicolinate synthase
MITPFHADGTVNYAEAKRVARYLVDEQKNDGLVVAGTTGESPTLSHSEKLSILEAVLSEVGDRAAVVFGAGTYNTVESMELAKEGEKAGADGVMAVNPYYNKPGQAGLKAHFEAVAGATTLPVMLYNIQPRAAINLETSTLLELAKIENIVAVKEASGNLSQISDVIRLAPEGFRVYSGDDGLTLAILALGGHGLVSVAAHLFGGALKTMIDSFESDPKKSRAIHHALTPGISGCFHAPNPVPVKTVLSGRGYDTATLRLPLVPASEAEKTHILEQVNRTEGALSSI